MLKKFIAAIGTLILAVGLSVVAVAAPSSAHTGDLNATAVCNPTTGQYDVTYKLTISSTSLAGTTYWRTGTTSFEGTPSSNTGLTNGPIASTGAGVYTLGTISLPGTSTRAPWAYAYTTWSDNFKKGSDGGDIKLDGTCTIPFNWDWQYAAPTCDALTVTYPADIPAGQANDVNVRIKYGSNYGTELTLNFHNNAGTWSGTQVFTYSTHPNWPANIGPFKVVWAQVGGTNYHWEGEVACNQPVPDASASVTIVPPTCSAGAQLVLNTPVNATWGAVTGAYSVTATANAGHTFPGGALTQTFTDTLAPANPSDCVKNDADASIGTTFATCAAPGAIDIAKTSLTNATWAEPLPTAPGSYTVVANANAGHAFAGGTKTKSFPIVIQEQLDPKSPFCNLPTEGLSVPTYTFTQTTCTAPGSYTVGASINPEFVEWREQGSSTVIPFNTKIVVDPARTVTLEATSTDPVKHGLQAPGGGDWTNPIVLKFVAATGCDLQLTTLALTGLGSGLGLTLAGGLVFLGIGGLLIFARRRQLTNN